MRLFKDVLAKLPAVDDRQQEKSYCSREEVKTIWVKEEKEKLKKESLPEQILLML